MDTVDIDWATARVSAFLDLLERDYQLWNSTGGASSPEGRASRHAIERELLVVKKIEQRVMPGAQTHLLLTDATGWRWRHTREAANMLFGDLLSRKEADEHLGPAGPQLAAESLHPWVWHAAADLWDGGHRRAAVQQAAEHVDRQLQTKVGREDITGKDLIAQVFRLDAPAKGEPRLRFANLEQGTPDYRAAHQGALNFGQGCFLAIRNRATHRLDELDEPTALEMLAALSLLARWIDEAEVVEAPSDEQG